MTAQFSERLIYEGADLPMCSNPLDDYFALGGDKPNFAVNCSALWRGYVGSWEIIDGRLYLVGLSGEIKGGGEASVATIFPDFPDCVFAHWYSGTLRIPRGKLLHYLHAGYGSTYEEDLVFMIEKGVVIGKTIKVNGKSDASNAPDGYGIGAMTVFAGNLSDDDKNA